MEIRIAVMVDGGFFLKRYRHLYGKGHSAKEVVKVLNTIILKHIGDNYLLRIFYYDCHPSDKKALTPISKLQVDFDKTPEATFRKELFKELTHTRKVALRLGELYSRDFWLLAPDIFKELLSGKIKVSDLKDENFSFDFKQKGIDIKLGVDIATLAYKKLVDRIVLISGDSDFVPAIKLARIEGIDVILDPMWNPIQPDLHEHIDGLQSFCKKKLP